VPSYDPSDVNPFVRGCPKPPDQALQAIAAARKGEKAWGLRRRWNAPASVKLIARRCVAMRATSRTSCAQPASRSTEALGEVGGTAEILRLLCHSARQHPGRAFRRPCRLAGLDPNACRRRPSPPSSLELSEQRWSPQGRAGDNRGRHQIRKPPGYTVSRSEMALKHLRRGAAPGGVTLSPPRARRRRGVCTDPDRPDHHDGHGRRKRIMVHSGAQPTACLARARLQGAVSSCGAMRISTSPIRSAATSRITVVRRSPLPTSHARAPSI